MHQFLKFIYFDLTLYMFRTVFPSIVRSSRLYIQQQAYVKQILLPAASENEMEHQRTLELQSVETVLTN
jgi:hypothetical protein